MSKWRDRSVALGVFAVAAALLEWLAGQRLAFINDEGIYLEGGRRILEGALPYRDFFVLTGPGAYWNVAAFFRVFGVSLAAGRLLLVLDVSLICACLYWITAKVHSRALGLWLAWFYLALLVGDASLLAVNHRWDSAALSVAAVALMFAGVRLGRPWAMALSGVAAAYAAWVTPPLLLVAMALLIWTILERRWKGPLLFGAGVGGMSAIAIAGLAWTGSLQPMVHHFLWTASQYSGANRFAYGSIIGGYGALFADAKGPELVVLAWITLLIALPAIAPAAGGLALLISGALRRTLLLPGLCAAAAVMACAPRLDVAHLTYGAPLAFIVASCGASILLPRVVRTAVALVLSLGGGVLMWNAVQQRVGLEGVATARGGTIVGTRESVLLAQDLERTVPAGAGFFAFPYLPIAYFVTRGVNPTRYSWLQPGMMSADDEASALTSLQAAPPGHILYINVTPEAYLRLFPSSDPARLRMGRMETWLATNYEPVAAFSAAHPGYQLLAPRAGALAMAR